MTRRAYNKFRMMFKTKNRNDKTNELQKNIKIICKEWNKMLLN